MKYDFLVFIGRFQPYHSGHHHVALEALKMSKHLIYVIGSHDRPRCIRNPFTTEERIQIIRNAFETVEFDSRIHFAPQVDYTYNDEKWLAAIQSSINAVTYRYFQNPDIYAKPKIGIIGYNKDQSSFYLDKFRRLYDVVEIEPKALWNATDIRHQLFDPRIDIPDGAFTTKEHYKTVVRYSNRQELIAEYRYVQEEKEKWSHTPYPPTFNTVDAVVTQSGHILLVKRAGPLGAGLWALPGGYVKIDKTHLDSVIDELREETVLDIPTPALVGSLAKRRVYDDPHRSVRGRTITEAFHFRLNDAYDLPKVKLPKVKGSDDATEADWKTFAEFSGMRSQMFEDHFSICEHMLGF